MKPCFFFFFKNSERIVVIESDKMVMEDDKVALTLHMFY